jgi:hypothetical protein
MDTNVVFGQGCGVDDECGTSSRTRSRTPLEPLLLVPSRAINEALSDIFGEFIDLSTHDDGTDDTFKAWQLGESIPFGFYFPSGGPLRTWPIPTRAAAQRGRRFYWQQPYFGQDPNADNGGVHTNSGPANRAAYLIAAAGRASGARPVEVAAALVPHHAPASIGANYQELASPSSPRATSSSGTSASSRPTAADPCGTPSSPRR